MRHSKRYIIFTVLVLVAFLIKLNNWNDEYAEVEAFRGAQLEDAIFYPLKAKNINEEFLPKLTVGETTYSVLEGFQMGDSMEPMVSLDFAQQLFGCSIQMHDEENILLTRNQQEYSFVVGSNQVMADGRMIEIEAVPECRDGKGYLPFTDLCALFECEFEWDPVKYEGMVSGSGRIGKLPERYDLRDAKMISEIRDQGNAATCWAQAALAALESSLLPEEAMSFNVDHMVEKNAFQIDSSLGGDYTMALAYLLSWDGPVTAVAGGVDKHVQEAQFFDQKI